MVAMPTGWAMFATISWQSWRVGILPSSPWWRRSSSTALAPPQEIIEVVEIDPRVDEDFDALDPSSLKQLNRFLKRYRDNSYAKAQGYVGQATEWRRHAIWRAEDKRLRRRQRSVQWIHE